MKSINRLRLGRDRKSAILETISELTGLHRKSVIRRFRVIQFEGSMPNKRKGRPKKYGADMIAALRTVWECSSELYGELLHKLRIGLILVFSEGMGNGDIKGRRLINF